MPWRHTVSNVTFWQSSRSLTKQVIAGTMWWQISESRRRTGVLWLFDHINRSSIMCTRHFKTLELAPSFPCLTLWHRLLLTYNTWQGRDRNSAEKRVGMQNICRLHTLQGSTTKRQEKRIEVNRMRMLRWMYGVTRNDTIRIEHIRGTRVAQGTTKITVSSMWWGEMKNK